MGQLGDGELLFIAQNRRIARKVYRTLDRARADVVDCAERFYNPTQRHSTIGYVIHRNSGGSPQRLKDGVRETGSSSKPTNRPIKRGNLKRPHEGIGFAVPSDRYRPSLRRFPHRLAEIVYPAVGIVRKVQAEGILKFKGQKWRMLRALRGHPVAIYPTQIDGTWNVRFMRKFIAQLDLSDGQA